MSSGSNPASGKMRRIKASDEISFAYNYEILNSCFGASMRGSLEVSRWDSKDGCLVWFPHLAKQEQGKYISTASNNWKNYFEKDRSVIIQMLYPDEDIDSDGKQPTLDDNNIPLHTFMKMGDKDYRFVGTYLVDYNDSSPRHVVHRLIKDEIDLSIWASGHDTAYFDTAKIGMDAYKGLYLEKSFRKQKEYLERFARQENELAREEKRFKEEKEKIAEKYGIAVLNTMSNEHYSNEFIPALKDTLNTLFDSSYTEAYLRDKLGTLQEYGTVLYSMLYKNDTILSINQRLRRCEWGTTLAAQILTIYNDSGYEYLYTLAEKDIDQILFVLGITPEENEDLVAKQSRLYFWRHCDSEIFSWSVYRYYQFLRYMTEIKRKNTPFVSAAKPDIRKRIISEAERLDEEVEISSLDEAPASYNYNSIPRVREIEISSSAKSGRMVPRHNDRKQNALARAGYCCEIDRNHPTFKRRNSDKNYTETHHLIPLEYSMEFQYTLDTEENIVSLCSNCHNQIHYGAGADKLIRKLFNERKAYLKAAGIDKTTKGIEIDETQLLHMYGLD